MTGPTATSTLATEVIGTPALNFTIFAVFVVVTLVIALSVARKNNSATDYYAGGRTFTGLQNGVATSGDYLSAATFLGTPGIIAIYGYDGILYSVGFIVGWLLVLLLVSEPFRNTGRYTMADVLDLRLKAPSVRAAAALSTLMVCLFYLLAQMAGAGVLVSLLLGVNSSVGQGAVVAVVGILMIFYVLVGGMKGTTWVQIVKATILAAGTVVTTIWLLSRTGFSLPALLHHAAASSRSGGQGVQRRDDHQDLSFGVEALQARPGGWLRVLQPPQRHQVPGDDQVVDREEPAAASWFQQILCLAQGLE